MRRAKDPRRNKIHCRFESCQRHLHLLAIFVRANRPSWQSGNAPVSKTEAIGDDAEVRSLPTAYAAVPQQEDGAGSNPVN